MRQRTAIPIIISLSIMFIGSALLLFSLQTVLFKEINYLMSIFGGLALTGILAIIIIKISKHKKEEKNLYDKKDI